MAMPVEPGPNLQVGIAEMLFDPAAYLSSPDTRHWDVSPDGRRLLMIGSKRARRPAPAS